MLTTMTTNAMLVAGGITEGSNPLFYLVLRTSFFIQLYTSRDCIINPLKTKENGKQKSSRIFGIS